MATFSSPPMEMNEYRIAKYKAEILLKRVKPRPSNDEDEDDDEDYVFTRCECECELEIQDEQLAWLETMTASLAEKRAQATNRDLKTVMNETQFKVLLELAKILEGTLDPVLAALKYVVVVDGGEDCCICHQEMKEVGDVKVNAMACGHLFHELCIYKWLKINPHCPLCRQPHRFQNSQ